MSARHLARPAHLASRNPATKPLPAVVLWWRTMAADEATWTRTAILTIATIGTLLSALAVLLSLQAIGHAALTPGTPPAAIGGLGALGVFGVVAGGVNVAVARWVWGQR